MRIISGKYKGKRLQAPKKLPVRPTTDFAKEGLFNILRNQFDLGEAKVLDLFAGTGNISFEFASRGAREITAVDSHKGCVRYIERIATELELPLRVVLADSFRFLRREKGNYDIIFADPPYQFNLEELRTLSELCFENELLSDEGILIIEHSKHLDLSNLNYFRHARRYGGSVFSFFGSED